MFLSCLHFKINPCIADESSDCEVDLAMVKIYLTFDFDLKIFPQKYLCVLVVPSSPSRLSYFLFIPFDF